MGLWFSACATGDPAHEDLGRIDTTLVTQSADGTNYRLEAVTIAVTGATSATLVSDDEDPNETELTAQLPVGAYTATLEPGWSLVRLDEDTATPVPATLLSPNPSAFTILSSAVTHLTLSFETSGGVIDFQPGTLEVDIDVLETTPTLPILTAAEVTLPGTVIDLAAGPNRAYVLTNTTLVGLAPDGSTLFQAPVPTGTPRGVLADGDSAQVIASTGSSLHFFRFDGTTGLLQEDFAFPTNSSIVAPSEVCVARGPEGLVLVATNENGADVRLRVFQGQNLHWMTTVSGSIAQPMRCDAFFKPDGRVYFGARTNAQRIFLSELSPTGTPLNLSTFGGGVGGSFQLADDAGPQSLFAAWGTPSGLRLSRYDGATEVSLNDIATTPSGVSDLVTGSFFGQSGTTVLVAGQANTAFLGAFTESGTPVSVNRDGGSSVVAADAGQGLIWTLALDGPQRLLRVYPQ